MKSLFSVSFSLAHSSIRDTLQGLHSFLANEKINSKDILSFSMTMEEFFLKNISVGNLGNIANVSIKKRFGKLILQAECQGANSIQDTQDVFSDKLINALQIRPQYCYFEGINKMIFSKNIKSIKLIHQEIIAIISAIIIILLLNLSGNGRIITQYADIFSAICQKFTSVLITISSPVIFLMIVSNIVSLGNSKNIGSKYAGLLSTFTLFNLIAPLIAIGLCFIFFMPQNPNVSTALSRSEGNFFLHTLLNIIPNDIVTPFAKGNFISVVFMGIVAGICMNSMHNRISSLLSNINLIEEFFVRILKAVCKLLPVFIFFSIFNFATKVENIRAAWILFPAMVLFFVCVFINTIAVIFWFKIKTKYPIFVVLKELTPAIVTSFMTSSTIATYSVLIEIIKKSKIVNIEKTQLNLPIALLLVKCSTSCCRVIILFIAANLCNIQFSVAQIPLILFIAILTSFASPSVGGGTIAMLPILLDTFGLSHMAIPILVAFYLLYVNVLSGAEALAQQVFIYGFSQKSSQ